MLLCPYLASDLACALIAQKSTSLHLSLAIADYIKPSALLITAVNDFLGNAAPKLKTFTSKVEQLPSKKGTFVYHKR